MPYRHVRSRGDFVSMPTFRVTRPPTSFAAWPDIKTDEHLTFEACYLFIPCLLANLGPSREHKRGNGLAPEVRGPATMLSRVEQTMQTFCSQVEMHLSHILSASTNEQSVKLLLMHSQYGTYRLFATDCNGSAQHRTWEELAGNTLAALTAHTLNEKCTSSVQLKKQENCTSVNHLVNKTTESCTRGLYKLSFSRTIASKQNAQSFLSLQEGNLGPMAPLQARA